MLLTTCSSCKKTTKVHPGRRYGQARCRTTPIDLGSCTFIVIPAPPPLYSSRDFTSVTEANTFADATAAISGLFLRIAKSSSSI